MSISWMLVSIPLGKLILRFGGKLINAIGMAIALLSLIPLLWFTQDSSLVFIIAIVFILGIGFGIAMTTQTMAIQDSVGFEKRGAAVAVNALVKTLGQTVGISIFGATFNAGILRGFDAKGIAEYDLGNLYDLSAYQMGVTWDQVVDVLLGAIHLVYAIFIGIAVVCAILSFIMPKLTPVNPQDADASDA
jgi:fucose permease